MCRRIECAKCGRPTFAGCGAHVEQVLGDVPPAARCRCKEEKTTAAETKAVAPSSRSWLKGLLGR